MGMVLDFVKMTGAGNDFIFLGPEGRGLGRAAIVALCDRRYGVGADGLMIVAEGRDGTGFEVDFHNSDGSSGMLCGNGARCALEYARLSGYLVLGEKARFRFGASFYSGAVLEPGLARFELSSEYEMRDIEGLEVGASALRGSFVDVGSLHFVIDVASIPAAAGGKGYSGVEDVPVEELGRAIRRHERFAPRGVNVNFISIDADRVRIRTFERGVEAETLACGTGSTASALVCWRGGRLSSPVRVITRSGETLVVNIGAEGGKVTSLSLTGPARKVFSGRVDPGELPGPASEA